MPSLGDIIVTAQKRAENVQKTPIAITAISADRIAQANLDRPDKLGFSVPSMTNAESSGFSFLTLRGVGNSTAGLSEATVATYQDGVYTGMQITQRVPTFDLERVEILRGPQGTLYGRNTTGGVVNYITKTPSFEFGAVGDVSYGNFDAIETNVGLTGPLVEDKIAAKASFNYSKHDGYYPNVVIGGRDYAERQIGGRLAVLLRPTENLSITVRGDATKNRSTNSYVSLGTTSLDGLTDLAHPLGIFSQPAAFFEANPGILSPADIAKLNGGSIASYYNLMQPGEPAPDPLKTGKTANRLPNLYKTKASGASITVDWDLGDVNVKSISAYRYGDLYAESDITGQPVPLTPTPRPLAITEKQYTQEFNFSGKSFDNRLDWLVGAFYYRDDGDYRGQYYLDGLGQLIQAGAFTANMSGSPYQLALNFPQGPLPSINSLAGGRTSIWQTALSDGPAYPGDPAGNVTAGVTIPQTPYQSFRQTQRSQSYAAFAQLTYHLTDKLRLTGGFRYTIDKKETHRIIHSNFLWALAAARMPDASDDSIATAAGLCDTRSKRTWKKPTGTIGIDYDLAPRVLTYAKVARGYKAGGMNNSECNNIYDPETLTDYEGGVKAVLADGQVLTNLSFYYYDYKNIQFLTFSNVSTLIKNAGSAKTFGVELEYAFRPKFAPGWQLDGAASFQESKYGQGCFGDPANTNNAGFLSTPKQACPATVLNPNTGQMVPIGASANIKGNDMIRAPRWKFNAGLQYSRDVNDFGNVMARFDAAWTDKFYNTIFMDKAVGYADTVQHSYWNLRALVAWTSPDKRFGLEVYGDNLTNKLYAVDRQLVNLPPTMINVGGLLGSPRTYGVRFRAKLGPAY
ncbi:TonB-dependent receptor [Sphingobium sp. EM0848]|uniref:TonB-dependent receptor n=1 Tax=Sphingobium sp. EM0848 TaxID=2743473 RepID=UPI00159C9375|nr:TonB-dependent receptor [Sphingobium sp. EM0848]